MPLPDEDLTDSIRKAQKSHRRQDASEMIALAIERQRELKVAREAPSQESVAPEGYQAPNRASLEDSLPLNAARVAQLGLTSIMPSVKAKDPEKFEAFLTALFDPDFRYTYPTYPSMAKAFGVSVGTIRAWLLSEEVGKAMEAAVSHEARMMMPAVLRSVMLRATSTGDPHAAEYIRKVAKLGTAETDSARSFEKTLRQLAAEAAERGKAKPQVKRVEVLDAEGEPLQTGKDPLDN